ncbi:hypothetical protein ACTA71_007556 [Dictyostelium dimigraforme]
MFGGQFGGFGAKPAATASPFGAPSTAPTTSLFGSSTPSSGFGGFGTTTTTTQPSTGGFGGFGGFGATTSSQPTASPFGGGTSGGSGLFGTSNTTAQPGAGPFGGFGTTTTTTTTQPGASPFGGSGGGLFGSSATTAQPGASPFGGFGATSTTQPSLLSGTTGASPFGGGFGSTTTGTQLGGGATGGGFGSSSPFGGGGGGGGGGANTGTTSSSPFGGGSFGATTQKQPGTPIPYQQTAIDGNTFVSISAMPQYNDRSFEELRFEDITHRKDIVYKTGGAGTTSLFGGSNQTTQTPFGGQTTTGGGLFGTQTTTSPFNQQTSGTTGSTLFGSTQPTQQSGGLFGSAQPTQQTSGGLFGNTGGLFGSTQPTQQTGGGLFGLSQPTQQTGGGLFGSTSGSTQPTTSLFSQTQTTSPFGQTTTSTPFGQPQSTTGGTSLFGSAQPTQQTGGLFGSVQPTQQPSTGLFGAPTSGTGLFGSSPTGGTGTGLFGAPASGTGLFGSSPTGTGTGLFNSTQPTQTQTSGGLFGSSPTPGTGLFGSTQPTQTQQPQTSLFGNTGATQTTTGTGGLFGSAQPSATTGTGLFGSAQPSATTGTGLFGSAQPSATTGTGLFGSTQPTAQPTTSLFGNTTTTGGLGATPTTGLFGSTPTTTGGLFSSTQPAQTSLFGATGSTGGLGATTGLFGNLTQPTATANQGLSGGLFGNTLGQPTATANQGLSGGLFGNTLGQPTTQLSSAVPTLTLGQPQQQQLQQGSLLQQTQQPLQQPLQQSTIQLNNQINSASPYFPISSPAPFATFVKDLTSTSKVVSPPSYTQRSLSHHGYIPKSTTKLVPRRGPNNVDLGFSVLQNQNGLFPIDKFITKHSKSLNINTTNETEDSLRSLNTKSSSLFNNNNNNSNSNNRNVNTNINDYQNNGLPSSSLYNSNINQLNNTNTYNNNNNNNNNISTQFNLRNNQSSSSENLNEKSSASSSSSSNKSQQKEQEQPPKPIKEKEFINSNAPKLTREGYQCVPSIKELSKKTDKELSAIQGFTISRDGCGSIYFPGSTNLIGLDLDDIVDIEPREVSVYKDEETKPEIGYGLNRDAVVTLENCWPKNKNGEVVREDGTILEKYENALKKVSAKSDCGFVSYSRSNGTWVFTVKHFSKYSAPDFDEDDQQQQQQQQQTQHQQHQKQPSKVTFQQPSAPSTKSKPKFTANLDNFDSDLDSDTGSGEEENQDEMVPQKKTYSKTPFIKRVSTRESGLFDTPSVVPMSEKIETTPSKIARVSEPTSQSTNNTLKFSTFNPQQQQLQSSRFKSTGLSILSNPVKNIIQSDDQQQSMFSNKSKIQPLPQQQQQSFQPILTPVVLNKNYFSKVRIDPQVYDRIVPKEESITNQYRMKNEHLNHSTQDASLFMRRSFRVGWAPGGKLISITKSSLKTLLIKKLPTDTKEDKKESIIKFLKDHHSHSSLVPENLKSIGWFSISNVQEQIESQLSLNVPLNQSVYYNRIWSLISNLWGNVLKGNGSKYSNSNYSEETIRKLNLNQWLKDVVTPLVRDEMDTLRKKTNSNYLEQIFSFLTAKQIKEASDLANENKDFRLATMMSQIWSSSESGKDLILKQLTTYHSNGSDEFINEKRLEILHLIAGSVNKVYKNLNDWIRCFAISFWFRYSLGNNIEDSVENFEKSFNAQRSVYPLPPYLCRSTNSKQIEEQQHYYDICFLLLKLFAVNRRSSHFDKFKNIFYPENIGQDLLDYHLSWNLYTVLKSIPSLNKQPDLVNASNLHSSFALQLERLGLWQWSIYVLLHTPDQSNHVREEAVKALIARSAPFITPEDRVFLTTKLHIPEVWIDEAKAWYSGYDCSNDIYDQIDALFKSYQYPKIHDIIFSNIGPNYVIQKRYHSLKDLLVRLEPHSSFISTWRYGGSIFLEFADICIQYKEILSQLSNTAEEIQRTKYYVNLKEITTRIVNLLSDISKLTQSSEIKNTSAPYKQSLSFMSEALITKAALLRDLPESIVKLVSTNNLVSTLNSLPLTQDYRSKNLESLTDQIQDTLLNSIYQ